MCCLCSYVLHRRCHYQSLTYFYVARRREFSRFTFIQVIKLFRLIPNSFKPLSRNMGLTFTNVYALFYHWTCIITFLIVSNLRCRICSVMMSRLTLNLRDPSLIPVTRHDASEDTSYPNLTFVQSHFPDELLGEGSFAESEFSQGRRSGEAFEIRDRHRPASKRTFPLSFFLSFSLSQRSRQ